MMSGKKMRIAIISSLMVISRQINGQRFWRVKVLVGPTPYGLCDCETKAYVCVAVERGMCLP